MGAENTTDGSALLCPDFAEREVDSVAVAKAASTAAAAAAAALAQAKAILTATVEHLVCMFSDGRDGGGHTEGGGIEQRVLVSTHTWQACIAEATRRRLRNLQSCGGTRGGAGKHDLENLGASCPEGSRQELGGDVDEM